MINHDEAETLLETQGHLLLSGAEDAGQVLQVYLDDYTGWPSFCTVAALSEQPTLVALHQAEICRGGVAVPYDRATIEHAPRAVDGQELTISQEDALFEYYGVPIDGVLPSVEHLGTALTPASHGGVATRDIAGTVARTV